MTTTATPTATPSAASDATLADAIAAKEAAQAPALAKFGPGISLYPQGMGARLVLLEAQALRCLETYEQAQAALEDTTERHAELDGIATDARAAALERLVNGGVAATPAEKAAKLDPGVRQAEKVADAAAREKRQADIRLSVARARLDLATKLYDHGARAALQDAANMLGGVLKDLKALKDDGGDPERVR